MTGFFRGGSDRDQEPEPRQPGYRGSLSPRNDRLGGPWVIAVVAIFVLVFALSFVGLPSRLFPASASPLPSEAIPSSSLPAVSSSPGASLTPAPTGSAASSPSPSASGAAASPASATPSPS